MTEEEQKAESAGRFDLSSKYWKVFLVVLAAILTFGGPYAVFLLTDAVNLSFPVSIISGFVLFVVGLILLLYLIRKGVIS
jgi:hypothetical protein